MLVPVSETVEQTEKESQASQVLFPPPASESDSVAKRVDDGSDLEARGAAALPSSAGDYQDLAHGTFSYASAMLKEVGIT